ncbi:MAG: hypothetical protein QOG70_4117 [Solirubrobacteraceae bacterium]|jgi:peptide-methionine (R)-S-oxide reductase|nr:hypothetical protein [Solirubrobacteraceae bacterium]
MPVSVLATILGAGRALLGVALLVAPAPILRRWVGRADAPAVVLGRCLGGRDVALGAGVVVVVARGGDPSPWLAAGVVADTGDTVATLAAGDRIPTTGRIGTVALAASSALAGVALAVAARR